MPVSLRRSTRSCVKRSAAKKAATAKRRSTRSCTKKARQPNFKEDSENVPHAQNLQQEIEAANNDKKEGEVDKSQEEQNWESVETEKKEAKTEDITAFMTENWGAHAQEPAELVGEEIVTEDDMTDLDMLLDEEEVQVEDVEFTNTWDESDVSFDDMSLPGTPAQGGKPVQVLTPMAGQEDIFAALSPNGSRIVMTNNSAEACTRSALKKAMKDGTLSKIDYDTMFTYGYKNDEIVEFDFDQGNTDTPFQFTAGVRKERTPATRRRRAKRDQVSTPSTYLDSVKSAGSQVLSILASPVHLLLSPFKSAPDTKNHVEPEEIVGGKRTTVPVKTEDGRSLKRRRR